jgi:hypothetical protein
MLTHPLFAGNVRHDRGEAWLDSRGVLKLIILTAAHGPAGSPQQRKCRAVLDQAIGLAGAQLVTTGEARP